MAKYYKTDLQKVRQDLDDFHSSLSSGFYKPKVGKNIIRIMPAYSEEGLFYKRVWVHFNVGPESQIVTCLRMFKKRCFICEQVAKLRMSEDEDDRELANRMKGRPRYLLNIVDLKDLESGVQKFSAPMSVWNNIEMWVNDKDWGDITDPQKGYDIILNRSGRGLGTKYTVQIRKEPTPLPDMSLLEQLNDLDEAVPVYSYEEQKEIYYGTPDFDEGEESKEQEETSDEIEEEIEDDEPKTVTFKVGEDIGNDVEPSCPDFGNFNSREECKSCPLAQDCMQATIEKLKDTSDADEIEAELKKVSKKRK